MELSPEITARIEAARERYAAEGGKHWVTISGTHVEVDGSGTIVSGPKAMRGNVAGKPFAPSAPSWFHGKSKSPAAQEASADSGLPPATDRAKKKLSHQFSPEETKKLNEMFAAQEARRKAEQENPEGKAPPEPEKPPEEPKIDPKDMNELHAEWNRLHNPTHGEDAKKDAEAEKTESPETKQAVESFGQEQMPTTPPPPGKVYAPNPADGKAARVGVPGMHSPPPPAMSDFKLPNLTPAERAEEQKFMDYFEKNPDAVAAEMIDKASRQELGNDGPNFFGTDDAKNLLPEWKGTPGPDGKGISEETRNYRAKFNTSLHQTANAIAKKAFTKYLDTVVSKLPKEKQNVLVTAGGCGAGKGFAISQIPQVDAIKNQAGAVWDTAGEQNSTELAWVAEECKKRGFTMSAAFIHADPLGTWNNEKGGVISRATAKGRMVCARAYADSYAHGSKNFANWHQTVKDDPNIQVSFINNHRGKPAEFLPEMPKDALDVDPEELYANCLDVLASYPTFDAAKEGGSACVRYWGPPKV